MNEHPSFIVFKHLPAFFKSRGLTLESMNFTPKDKDSKVADQRAQFVTELNHVGYFRADATDESGRTTIVLILALRGKYTERGPQLRSLIGSLDSEDVTKSGKLAEVLVLAPEEILSKKNMTDIIVGFRKREHDVGADFYNMYAYYVLSVNIPRARCVPRHEIVPVSEVKKFLARSRLLIQNLKTMSISSPPVIWIGGRPGQVVRTVYPSQTSGEAHDYWILTP